MLIIGPVEEMDNLGRGYTRSLTLNAHTCSLTHARHARVRAHTHTHRHTHTHTHLLGQAEPTALEELEELERERDVRGGQEGGAGGAGGGKKRKKKKGNKSKHKPVGMGGVGEVGSGGLREGNGGGAVKPGVIGDKHVQEAARFNPLFLLLRFLF